jgi:hypothetical protein
VQSVELMNLQLRVRNNYTIYVRHIFYIDQIICITACLLCISSSCIWSMCLWTASWRNAIRNIAQASTNIKRVPRLTRLFSNKSLAWAYKVQRDCCTLLLNRYYTRVSILEFSSTCSTDFSLLNSLVWDNFLSVNARMVPCKFVLAYFI